MFKKKEKKPVNKAIRPQHPQSYASPVIKADRIAGTQPHLGGTSSPQQAPGRKLPRHLRSPLPSLLPEVPDPPLRPLPPSVPALCLSWGTLHPRHLPRVLLQVESTCPGSPSYMTPNEWLSHHMHRRIGIRTSNLTGRPPRCCSPPPTGSTEKRPCLSSLTGGNLQKDTATCLPGSLLYPQCLEQCLEYSRCSINIY